MEFLSEQAQQYAERYSSREADLLQDIARRTWDHHADPQMLSGHVQGKFLEMISKLLHPLRILEIGTFVGYSAICLAKGLMAGGKLHTIELSPDDSNLSQANFNRAKLGNQIILHTGNALDILPTLDEIWDLVFIDADKPNYNNYYRLVFPRVRPGGLIIADNVLFHGQVLDAQITGKNAKAIQAFNEMISLDNSVEKVMLTVRDGLFLIRKKTEIE